MYSLTSSSHNKILSFKNMFLKYPFKNLCFINAFLKFSSVSVPRKDVREISETSPKPDAVLKQGKNNLGIRKSIYVWE